MLLNCSARTCDATFLEADRREIALRRGPHNRLGFVRVLGRFPQQAPLEIDGEILRFAALQLSADAETIHAYARRQQTVSVASAAHRPVPASSHVRHRRRRTAGAFLEDEALRLDRTGSLLARARDWLRDEHVLAPADSVLRRAVGAARQKARALLTQRMAERLSAPMREGLDALVAVDDDQPHSPLNRIKASSSNPSVGGHEAAAGEAETDRGDRGAGSRRRLGQRQLPADPVSQRANRVSRPGAQDGGPTPAPGPGCASCTRRGATRHARPGRRHVRQAPRPQARLDDMLKAQRQAVDRIVHRYRRLGAVLLDPDVGDDELRARLLSTVPEAQLREDQSDLANWTRGDRKARFEQTAERHAGLSRFAGPFLSRMKFVDEQGEGASPTLSALRAYREHRAAGRRGVPPDAPLDFAPVALQPLIRHDGVTDRRRWESALFPQGARRDPDRQPRHRRREELRPIPPRRSIN